MTNVFEYTNYHTFLQDYYEEQKKENSCFSYQYWANKCGFKSKTFLYKIVKGDKQLSIPGTLKIASYMKMKKQERSYFEALVEFGNAKTAVEKEFRFAKLQEFCKDSTVRELRKNQFEYFSHWYNAVLRELVTIIKWNGNFSVLAKAVSPSITIAQAKKSIALLEELQLIKKREDGEYEQCDTVITTGKEISSVAITSFHRENLELALESIDRYSPEECDISTLTASVSANGEAQIKEEIALFRKKLIKIIQNDNPVDRVCQVNFQVFPLSKTRRETN